MKKHTALVGAGCPIKISTDKGLLPPPPPLYKFEVVLSNYLRNRVSFGGYRGFFLPADAPSGCCTAGCLCCMRRCPVNIRFEPNTLYYGDCLDIMSDFPDGCVDLVCLDPPFNSNAKYHAIFRNSRLSIQPQIKAFDDMWQWDTESAARVAQIKNAIANPASKVIAGFEQFVPQSQMLSYTSYMAQRLFEMHRILKDTGSIYLHCDPTASHYLKLVMDAVFGEKNFRNEIVWHYRRWTAGNKNFQRMHDVLLRYTKSDKFKFNVQYEPYGDWIKKDYTYTDKDGRRWRWHTVKGERYKVYLEDENRGVKLNDVWQIPHLGSTANERLGYPTQKPLALYDRIIKASSNPEDIVLDPFAGCGTTVEAAIKNNRRVIGIDILPFALRLINQHRILPNGREAFPVQGVPVDKETAFELAARDPFKFQDWAISLIDGLAANPKKISDEGADGFGLFFHKPDNMDAKAIIVQVTAAGGSQKAKFDKLQSDVRNHNAAMGILITRDVQTARRNWRVNLSRPTFGETTYDPMQCFSIEEYYRYEQRYEPLLKLPPLANPWTGKQMQTTLFEAAQTYE